mmetsp:Transcript_12474/g.34736  ORF Transcript_12474/g.34736 Transcript_12474/m.34736 type:complete len:220 (-) Transcript_12474:58-717(-)
MRGQELGHRVTLSGQPGHRLWAVLGGEACPRHQLQPYCVSLVLALAGVRQLKAQDQGGRDKVCAEGQRGQRRKDRGSHLLRDLLRVMPCDCVGDLVSEDHGKLLLALEDTEEARVHNHLAPWQNERVYLWRVHKVELPLELLHVIHLATPVREVFRLLGNLRAYPLDQPRQLVPLRQQLSRLPLLCEEILVHLGTQRPLLIRRYQHKVPSIRVRNRLQV